MTPTDVGTQSTGTRTHDTRRIDTVYGKAFGLTLALQSITVPDLRATCSVALTNIKPTAGTSLFKECPDVNDSPNQGLWDIVDDQGVRPSDHNFMTATFNVGPIPAISCPATVLVGEPVVCDGSGSVGVNGQLGWSTASYSDGTVPVSLNFGDNRGTYSEKTLLKAPHVYLVAGTYTVTLTVKDTAKVPSSITTSITVTDIPAATGGGIITLTDQGSTGANCTALSNALTTAFGANTVEQEIRLPAITYTCQLTVPTAAGTKYVTIRPTVTSWLPGPTVRVTPALSANMPKIASPGVDLIPLTVPGGRSYLRLLGIEFDKAAGHLYQFIEIGSGVTTYASLPHHIIVDRCYFKGNPLDDTARAIFVNADSFSLLNSYVANMQDGGVDAQAIAGFNASRVGLVNNFLEGYGENVLFGGADAGIKFQATCVSGTSATGCTLNSVANLRVGDGISLPVGGGRGPWSASIVRSIVGSAITFDPITNSAGTPTAPDTSTNGVRFGASPQDIFIARNHLYKSLTYRVVDPSYIGKFVVVKNSFELKHAMRVVFDGNVIENMWGGQGQSGPTVLFTPRNQTCYLITTPHDPVTCPEQTNPWTMVRDVQLTNSRMIRIPNFINILGTDNLNPPGTGDESGPSQYTQYIYAGNNLLENVDTAALDGQIGTLAFVFPGAKHITVTHHTLINAANGSVVGSTEAGALGFISNDVKVLNSIMRHGDYGFIGDGHQANDFMATFFPDGRATHNVMSDELASASPSSWFAPLSGPNYFPATLSTNTFVNLGAGDYHLAASSPYKAGNATPAADGLDIGVNVDTVNASTLSTISGSWALGGGGVVGGTGNGVKGKAILKGKAVIR
jgi:PKD repeat protein